MAAAARLRCQTDALRPTYAFMPFTPNQVASFFQLGVGPRDSESRYTSAQMEVLRPHTPVFFYFSSLDTRNACLHKRYHGTISPPSWSPVLICPNYCIDTKTGPAAFNMIQLPLSTPRFLLIGANDPFTTHELYRKRMY